MEGAGAKLWGWDLTNEAWVLVQVDSQGRLVIVSTVANLDDIGDVNVPTPADGDCLVFNSATSTWIDEQRAAATHASQHQNGGSDEISVAGLSGELADDQPPKAHKTSHQDGGADEVDVTGLSGLLADDQHVLDAEVTAVAIAKSILTAQGDVIYASGASTPAALAPGTAGQALLTGGAAANPSWGAPAPAAHAASHQTAGSDALDVKDLDDSISLLLGTDRVKDTHVDWGAAAGQVDADDVPESATKKWAGETGADVTANNAPQAHASQHQNGGADEISVLGLSGLLADGQTPLAHKASHENGGGDEMSLAGLSGDPADTINKSLLTTRGDLIRRGAAAPERVALGTNGQKLASDGTDAVWEDDLAAIEFIIDGGGSAITTGQKGHLEIPFACTITRVTLLADQSGSIVIDIWKDTYANFPPTDANSITASAPPTISSAQKSQDSTLTGWTTAITAGDILAFNVDSITTVTRVTLALKVTKT
jgi:hypothetical protein